MRSYSTVFGLLLVAAYVTLSTAAVAQTSPPEQAEHPAATAAPVTSPEPGEHGGSIVGSVVSVSRQTMVVRTEDNQFHLFVYDDDLVRPKDPMPGARIRVLSDGTGEPGVLLATRITILEPASTSAQGPVPDLAPPPKEVRTTEREIEKLARRWQIGVRVGGGWILSCS